MTLDDTDRQQINTMIQAAFSAQSPGVNGLTRNGVVQSYHTATRVAQVLLDGDAEAVPIQSIQGLVLEIGQRVVVMFQEPSGAVVIGYAGDPLVADILTIQAKSTIILDAPNIFDIGPWVFPFLENGWVDFGSPFQQVAYRHHGQAVEVRGAVMSGTIGQPVFHLDPGYRPAGQTYQAIPAAGSSAFAVGISVTGGFTIYTGLTGQTLLFCEFALG